MTLRDATPLDAGAVGGILSEVVDVTPWLPRVRSRAEDLAHAGTLIDAGWITLAEVAGQVRGFIARDGEEVHGLYLAPEATGRGFGRALLDDAKACRARLLLWVHAANAGAQRFYLREGFREAGRGDGTENDEGLPEIRFVWEEAGA
ncbi:GNAT family N-acetyltransferase [Aquicoccus sp. SCR17]|nr:GNAT family N-acetyltransferase [Carideicomes alvinocaridis]